VHRFDVIVIGAGPAGSTAARHLAQQGAAVALLEKESFPRYKACGGGVTGRAVPHLGQQLPESLVEATVHEVTLTFRNRWPVTVTNDEPIVYMTMRSALDAWLAEEAVSAGAELFEQTRAVSVEQNEEAVRVHTKGGSFAGRVLIGADGVNSRTGRQLGLAQSHEKALTLETELKVTESTLHRFRRSVVLDYGLRPNGYAWVFPKREHLSVGIGSSACKLEQLRALLAQFCKKHELEGQVKEQRGFFVSVGGEKERLHCGRSLLVGDAAGLVDPLFGEGIYYALLSGKVAAAVVTEALQETSASALVNRLSQYQGQLEPEVTSELAAVRRFSEFFYSWPYFFHFAFLVSPGILEAVMQVLAGERDVLNVLPVNKG
jgi:geranylgeranyl reductase family protein